MPRDYALENERDLALHDIFNHEIDSEWYPSATGADTFFPLHGVKRQLALLVFFDSEVCNGGFEQWLSNPTGKHHKETLAVIASVDSEGVLRVATDAVLAYEQCDTGVERGNVEVLENLSDLYYEIRAEFLQLCLDWCGRNGLISAK